MSSQPFNLSEKAYCQDANFDQYEAPNLLHLMAKEFLEERLGLRANTNQVSLFVNHIYQFQAEIAHSSPLNS